MDTNLSDVIEDPQAAVDEIATLKEHVKQLNILCEFNEDGQRMLIELLAECKKDAERVRFLRENTGIDFEWVDRFCFGNGEPLLDAAMAQKEKA